MEKMDFGDAIKALKNGKRVSRYSWGVGQEQYLYYVPSASYPVRTEVAVKQWGEGGLVPYEAYIALKTVHGTVVIWNASQADMLSEDWLIVS